LDAWKFL